MVHLKIALSLLAMLGSTYGFQGSMTWYSPRGAIVGCSPPVPDTEMGVALPAAAWDGGAHCGKQVTVTANGKTVRATVLGQSVTFVDALGLDATPELFQTFDDLNMGIINAVWSHV